MPDIFSIYKSTGSYCGLRYLLIYSEKYRNQTFPCSECHCSIWRTVSTNSTTDEIKLSHILTVLHPGLIFQLT